MCLIIVERRPGVCLPVEGLGTQRGGVRIEAAICHWLARYTHSTAVQRSTQTYAMTKQQQQTNKYCNAQTACDGVKNGPSNPPGPCDYISTSQHSITQTVQTGSEEEEGATLLLLLLLFIWSGTHKGRYSTHVSTISTSNHIAAHRFY